MRNDRPIPPRVIHPLDAIRTMQAAPKRPKPLTWTQREAKTRAEERQEFIGWILIVAAILGGLAWWIS